MTIAKSRSMTATVRVRAMRDLTIGHVREFLEDCDKAAIPEDTEVHIGHNSSDSRLNEIFARHTVQEEVE